MKIVNPDWNRQIQIEENTISVIIIENRKMFREVITDLKNQMDGAEGKICLIDENEEAMKPSKHLELILNYIHLELNDKKVLNKLYANLREKAIEDFEKYSELISILSEYVQELISDEDLELVQLKNIDPVDIFKGVSLEIEKENLTETERVLEYISLMENVLGKRVVIFVNLKSYFSEEEVKMIYDTLLNKKVAFTLIESNVSKEIDLREKYYIIDEDFCEI